MKFKKEELIMNSNKKEYYQLSYLDDFGSGSYEYFYCTEDQIKIKAKEIFNSEIGFVISSDKLEESTSNKCYEFDELDCKGYITKDVGFILAHHIKWEKLDINSDNKKIRNIYILSSISHWVVSDFLGIYTNLKEGKKQLKLKLEKPSELAIEDDNGEKLPNGICIKNNDDYVCSYYYWDKTSYEYEEYDIASNTNILQKKTIIIL